MPSEDKKKVLIIRLSQHINKVNEIENCPRTPAFIKCHGNSIIMEKYNTNIYARSTYFVIRQTTKPEVKID
jgi:hypothetical protein